LALARLRRQFNDPLFVRTAGGMVPTPHAVTLLQPLRQALELLRVATRQQVVFDPGSSSRTFHIAMTDISHLEFLPSLINKIPGSLPRCTSRCGPSAMDPDVLPRAATSPHLDDVPIDVSSGANGRHIDGGAGEPGMVLDSRR
jgi:DNA-binding transcriptional LysR family regulator